MSKAEEKAEEYADRFVYTINHRRDVKEAFWDGYAQGKKETIDKAVKWLQEHASEYIVDIAVETYPDAPQKLVVGGMCWVYLKQTLEEEK